jgi:predicted DNA binding CopG/RHH family protein
MNNIKNNKIPKFKNENEERDFWAKTDSTDVLDWSKAQSVEFGKLKPSVHSISLRLPDSLLGKLKILANKKDVPYQTLLKIYLAERVDCEYMSTRSHAK